MQLSEQGVALIKRFEGFSPQAYVCPAGKWTIGYGHMITPGESYIHCNLSEEAAEDLLKQDISKAEQGVISLIEAPVNQGQFDALVSFTYNVGVEAFEKSSLLRLLNAENYVLAGQEFGRWVYAGGVKISGLITRRAAEAALFQGLKP